MISLNRISIEGLLDFEAACDAIRLAYIATSNNAVSLPPVGHISFPEANGDCHIKAGHLHGQPIFVVKIATGFYDNPMRGLSSSNGVMVAFSAETGEALAILNDEGWLTDIRTGIGGALASMALARSSARKVLIVGAGLQCRFQAECLSRISKEPFVYSVWARSPEKAENAVKDLAAKGLSVQAEYDLEKAVREADIIITTTPSTSPIILDQWVQPGTHITAVGADSPGKQELETALVARADLVVCDLTQQSLDHGEFQHARACGVLPQVIELGQILNGDHPGRPSDDAITIADLTGIAPQDIAVAGSVLHAYQNRKDK